MVRMALVVMLISIQLRAADVFTFSQLALAGAQSADIASSLGKHEGNPLLRGGNGTFSGPGISIKAAAVSGLWVFERLSTKKSPRTRRVLTVVNYVAAGALTVLAARNFRTPRSTLYVAPGAPVQ